MRFLCPCCFFWGAFFETPRQTKDNNLVQEKNETNLEPKNNNITPTLNEEIKRKFISRQDSIAQVSRITINNEKVSGSISLTGGIFDDLSFKNYKQDLNSDEKVVFLHPKQTQDGYYIETGWTSLGNKIKVPTLESVWSPKGNRNLDKNTPVILEWNNGQGLILKK